ncbi:hypothetical protein KJ359_005215 [Pestalotiopsis sp. 9143b]|nr:hypothetical protein KJ359_005215 [Pestalotiopsis sp. 9143b]
MPSTTRNYQVIAAEKKAQQWDKILKDWRLSTNEFPDGANLMDVPTTCGVLSDIEIKITSDYDATALLEKLKAGVWSVEQVTLAFCKRAAIAHQLTNCLTEIIFDNAIERAKKLDSEFVSRTGGKALPPLFGLPVSLKDSFDVAGYDSSTGLGCYVDQPAEANSALAALLIDLGAVLYCKTNLPQTIMTGDTHNNIFGRTLNPRNTLLTAGGSTGGEGALIALRGSILGDKHYEEQLARTGTTLEGLFELNDRRAKAAKAYLEIFCDNKLDAIMMPPSQHTAVPHDCWKTASYTSLWNYLDYPAVVIPVDEVKDVDYVDDLSNAKFGPEDEKMYSLYTGPEQYRGVPVSVQLVGYRHRDEALMRVVEVLDSIIEKA